MADITEARNALVKRILEGQGETSPSQRMAAFENSDFAGPVATLVHKVARYPYRVTDEDFAAAEHSGLSEDQVFEIAVCAAVGQATRQHDAAITALQNATEKE